jgi:hypothetical protein
VYSPSLARQGALGVFRDMKHLAASFQDLVRDMFGLKMPRKSDCSRDSGSEREDGDVCPAENIHVVHIALLHAPVTRCVSRRARCAAAPSVAPPLQRMPRSCIRTCCRGHVAYGAERCRVGVGRLSSRCHCSCCLVAAPTTTVATRISSRCTRRSCVPTDSGSRAWVCGALPS